MGGAGHVTGTHFGICPLHWPEVRHTRVCAPLMLKPTGQVYDTALPYVKFCPSLERYGPSPGLPHEIALEGRKQGKHQVHQLARSIILNKLADNATMH